MAGSSEDANLRGRDRRPRNSSQTRSQSRTRRELIAAEKAKRPWVACQNTECTGAQKQLASVFFDAPHDEACGFCGTVFLTAAPKPYVNAAKAAAKPAAKAATKTAADATAAPAPWREPRAGQGPGKGAKRQAGQSPMPKRKPRRLLIIETGLIADIVQQVIDEPPIPLSEHMLMTGHNKPYANSLVNGAT